jgi:hypothetical protein
VVIGEESRVFALASHTGSGWWSRQCLQRRRKGVPVTRDEKNFEAADCIPAMLFGILWETLNDVMGSASTATLVRRAVKRASSRVLGLDRVAITRERFEYRYVLPESWRTKGDPGMSSLRGLTRELQQLLIELTGPVVLHRLVNIPELRRCGLFDSEVDQ